MNNDTERLNLLIKLGLIPDPNNDIDVEATLYSLAPFTKEQLMQVYMHHKQISPYPLKVCDVFEYVKQLNGTSDAQTESKAALIYERYFKHPKTGFDHVADKRTVYAFKVAFGSLTEYGSRTNFIDGIDKKEFIKAYVNASPNDYKFVGNVIEGRNHRSNDAHPTVVCIGSQEQVGQIARELYGEQAKLVYYQAPQPKVVAQVAYQPLQERVVDEKQRLANIKKLQDVISKMAVRSR